MLNAGLQFLMISQSTRVPVQGDGAPPAEDESDSPSSEYAPDAPRCISRGGEKETERSRANSLEEHLASLPEWQDDNRCLSLFSSFRGDFEDNRENWLHRIRFWSDLISLATFRGYLNKESIFSFQPSSVYNGFARKGASPLGMGFIINYQLQNGYFVSYPDFVARASGTHKCSIYSYLKSMANFPLGWLSAKTKEFAAALMGLEDNDHHELGACKVPEHRLVAMSSLKNYCTEVEKIIKSGCTDFIDSCVTILELQAYCNIASDNLGVPRPSNGDIELVLKYFDLYSRDMNVFLSGTCPARDGFLYVDLYGGVVLDRCLVEDVCNLKRTSKLLDGRLQSLEREIERMEVLIRANALKNEKKALICLKKKKLLLQICDKYSFDLQNIEEITASLRTGISNQDVLTALDAGHNALKKVLSSKISMSADQIEELLLDISDNVNKEKDIQNLIASFGKNEEYDEDELEAELRQLARDRPLEGPAGDNTPADCAHKSGTEASRKFDTITSNFGSLTLGGKNGSPEVAEERGKEEEAKKALLAENFS